ncbi:hypothetical protein BR93DRAFT_932034 [Coniochaeta sp. PMI_546]|nr:hypothetical protein BR93DRAFT_932034 [Coniochaeta sp. PMI_546]
MESFIPMGGYQLPFQRRLSRLYNDTKKSSDFVKEPVQNAEDPEIKALHRKLRIQKDRLVSWGLEWSDPSQSAEILIDSSLSKAGLSEVVGSIMSTIKDILAEAEPLWHSSRRLAGSEKGYDSEKSRDQKIPLVSWDKGRFEDLVRDLTSSIDTLYDLSRTRSSYAQSSEAARQRLFKTESSTEDIRAFEPSRMQTPHLIDPMALTNLRSMQAEPMTEMAQSKHSREIVFMSKQAYSGLTHGPSGRQPHSPLLLEYANFDPIFSATGIPPPMTRFEKLWAGLQAEPQRSPGSWTGLPRLLGHFEDTENSRYGLVYQFPATFNPVTFEHLTQNPLYNLCSLADLLARPDFEPKLEAKFRLAANLANTVFDLHARGITHGNLIDTNISFCNAVGTDPGVSGMTTGEVDIRRPLVSSFDLFSDTFQSDQTSSATFSLYKHPLDPRSTAQSPLSNNADSKTFDLYSLSMLLLSIGLWNKLENLVPDPSMPSIPESVLEQLAIRCGTLYMKAVQTCWNAVDQEMAGQHTSDQVVARVQLKASRYLEACCILDGVSNLEERLSDDLGEARAQPTRLRTVSLSGSSKDEKSGKSKGSVANTPTTSRPQTQTLPTETSVSQTEEARIRPQVPETIIPASKQASTKMRLYPHVALSADIVEQWNKVLMPQINMALRHFYRKHPESVEISLESIGESPQRTQPTVLVVCTSVGKVRAILKKQLGILFDGRAGFGLKVCRGQVLRSRNRGVGRSMKRDTDIDDISAANPDYQERPQNGASIGAWIGDRHLPPVSFGGLIMVDDKPYGMTVHHMLDDPDQDQSAGLGNEIVGRSMARGEVVADLAAWYAEQYQTLDDEAESSGTEDFACEFSDSESEAFSESDITSEASEDEQEDDYHEGEAGDIPGIEPGCGDGYIVTQPALDDVEEGFYPSPETQNDDHLDTFSLGEVYASSGIRRRSDQGLIHEIDWALFEFQNDRRPEENLIPSTTTPSSTQETGAGKAPTALDASVCHPTAVTPASSLPGLEVQCMARTSGLQTGLILPALTSVKIYGRKSPSHTYQISGTTPETTTERRRRRLPMGVPGDSGAWVVDRQHGHLCGHVLAWSERKRVAYICPMDVLLRDILETLEASEIRLPGAKAAVVTADKTPVGNRVREASDEGWEAGDERDLPELKSGASRGGSDRIRDGRVLETSHQQAADGDDEDSYDEGVEVDIANEMNKLHLSGLTLEDLHLERMQIK